MKSSKRPLMLSPAELSERWGVALGTLSNWRVMRVGPPYVKLHDGGRGGAGGTVRYRIADIEAYERQQYVETNGEAA